MMEVMTVISGWLVVESVSNTTSLVVQVRRGDGGQRWDGTYRGCRGGQATSLIIKPRHNGIPLIHSGIPCIGGSCHWTDYLRVVYRNIGHVISMLSPSADYCASQRKERAGLYPLTTRVCTRHRSPRSCGCRNCCVRNINSACNTL